MHDMFGEMEENEADGAIVFLVPLRNFLRIGIGRSRSQSSRRRRSPPWSVAVFLNEEPATMVAEV